MHNRIQHINQIFLLAILYIATGKLGLMLALPPGYATVIWPPSGIAIGMLLVYGWRLWPGILLGSFLLNCYISNVYSLEHGLLLEKSLPALGIAAGSTLQALIGWIMVKRVFGLPLRLNHVREMVTLFALCGPVACLIAATIGVGTLYASGVVHIEQFVGNWLTWWMGDMLGVLVFMPLILIAPGRGSKLIWRGNQLGSLSVIAMLALITPLGLTFYAWKITSENVYAKQHAEFEALAQENEHALISRLESYEHALLGGVAYFQGSKSVERQEWHSYVQTVRIKENFPGISGIGYIEAIDKNELESFIADTRQDDAPAFKVHPETINKPYYVIKYIEPEISNQKAVGLNIGFEENRQEAAELSRDTGDPAITKKITLVQDAQKTPGFLLLHPYYGKNLNLNTPEERRAALKGWVYAPFIAKNFLHELTPSQDSLLNIQIYDGSVATPQQLIYRSSEDHTHKPAFTVRKKLNVMQQEWLIVWTSTVAYEKSHKSDAPIFVIIGGLLFSGLFGLFLLLVAVRNKETVEWIVQEKSYLLPVIIFLCTLGGTIYLHSMLKVREAQSVRSIISEQAEKIRMLIETGSNSRFLALKRMGLRWEAAGRTPEKLWRKDSYNYVGHIPGLTTLEWVDSTYHVRWAEPMLGNEKVIGMNILFSKERENALKGAADRETITITPPLDLVQGYKAFIVYSPVRVNNRFDGFMTGIFAVEAFFKHSIPQETKNNFEIVISHEHKPFFENRLENELDTELSTESVIHIYDRKWTLRLTPSKSYVSSNYTTLPGIIFAAGLLIASLLSLTVRAILIAKMRAIYLSDSHEKLRLSEEKHRMLVDGLADYAIYWLNTEGKISSWNKGAQNIKGYTEEEVLGQHFSKFFTEEDRIARLPEKIIQTATEAGKYEGEGWRMRKNGERFYAHVLLEPITDFSGHIIGFAKISQDITERRRLEQEKSHLMLEEQKRLADIVAIQRDIAHAHHDLQLAINLTIERVRDITAAEGSVIEMLEGEDMVYRATSGSTKAFLGMRMPVADSLAGTCLRENVVLKCDDVDTDKRVNKDACRKIGIASMVVVPLTDGKKPVGVLKVVSSRKHAFNDKHIGSLQVMAGVLSAALSDALINDSLRQSEETFRSAMESAPIGMALVKPNGKWITINPALSELLGYSAEELMNTDFQSITHPDDLKKDIEYMKEVLSGKLPHYQMEKRYFHKNGKVIWTLLSVSLVRHANGKPNYFISQIQDITEQKEIERIKSEFISIVSHELRTPLTSIRGSLGLILGALSKELPEKVKTLIDIAHNNSERLILLINDILDIDKIAAGKMRFDMKDESLAEITSQAVQANQAYAQKFNVRIDTGNIDGAVRVHVDAARYIQVLSNLLSNAAKFSPPESMISVFTIHMGKHIRICVQDEGPGIAEEFRARIFSKFSQADSSVTRSKGGTGLGLHIAKQITESMQGSIGFESTTGKGTTFWVEFPLVHPDTHVTESAVDTVAYEASPLPLILHVEDDADLTNVLATALHEQAHMVSATTLKQAAYYLGHVHFDMMILDVGMPDGNGLDLLERLPSLSKEPLSVVILSADSPPAEVHERVAAVMVKSRMSEIKIVEIIQSILQQKGATHAG